jgi:hypothetical protein
VVIPTLPGTAEAFIRIRERRPDIFLLAGEIQEDPALIARAADLAVTSDFIAQGYLIPYIAKELGAKTLIHISFPRHMIDEPVSRRRALMEESCNDLGLRFFYENSLDPFGQEGFDEAKAFIDRRIPEWLEKYGPDTAFFSTHHAHDEPLVREIAKRGGYFIEGSLPSPFQGYPEALNLSLEGASYRDFPGILLAIEKEISLRGAAGRLGSWPSSLVYAHLASLVSFGKMLIEGQAKLSDTEKLEALYRELGPGGEWKFGPYSDASGQMELPNLILAYQDSYVFGKGLVKTTQALIPEKFRGRVYGQKPPSFHIGIVTGSLDQGAEDFLGAKEILQRYGQADAGGLIRHVTYPDNFDEDIGGTVASIAELADDPLMKAIVVNQAVPGTAEAFLRVKAKRPDIVCLAGESHEEPSEISKAADLVVNSDFIARGYLIPYAAKEMGAKAFVHISFPRHMNSQTIKQRQLIMEEASKDLGLRFALESAPDPLGNMGVDGAREAILEAFPGWIDKYGPNAAFFCTNDAHTEPLLKAIAQKGGYFVEADIPSPILGYPEAFDLDIQPLLGEWERLLKAVEGKVIEAGAGGRLGTWAYPLGFIQTAGMAEFGKLIAEGKASPGDIRAMLDCYGHFSPVTKWNGSFYNDSVTGKPYRNFFLIYQDTYVFGRGYIGTAGLDIPDKYFTLTAD